MVSAIKAYSYLRFSTPEQAEGHSFERQYRAAKDYAKRHGLDLQEVSFRDLGVSAYRGKNAIDGALGQFIATVDDGSISRGSYLLVENLDRLSRDRIMPALNRFSALLEKGINIVTLSDGKLYTQESLNNLPDLMLSLLAMSRAHEESKMKSQRLKAAWQNKRDRAAEGGHVLTAMAPAWLRLVRRGDDRIFEIRKDRAAVVRRIFKMALAGHGTASIAHRLNTEGVEPFGDGETGARSKADGWHPSYIRKILGNEAVIGRFQPMRRVESGKKHREPDGPPIDNYFPGVLKDSNDFYRVRRAPAGASGRTVNGRHYPLANVLSGLVKCERCGGMLHNVNKGRRRKTGTSDRYLACDNARRKGTCDAPAVRYRVVLAAIINSLESGEIDLRSMMDVGGKDRRPQLRHTLDAIEGRIAETEASIANLLDALERRPSPPIEKRLEANEAALAKLKEEKSQTEDELRQAANGNGDHVGELLEAARTFNRTMASGDREGVGELNVRLNAALKRIIARIEIGVSGAARDWMDKGVKWADRLTKGKALPTPTWKKGYADIMDGARISIGVAFKVPGRLIVIYADPRKPGRYVAGALTTGKSDRIEEFALKISAG
jgi:DNA invertase Pin-like site-specific DNA recombinase